MKNNPNVVYIDGAVKGVYIKHSETVLTKPRKKKYETTLQEVNDRICLCNFPSGGGVINPVTERKSCVDCKKCGGKDPDELFNNFMILVRSSAVLRGYQRPSKVRGGTVQDVNDFFIFSVISLLERRVKQFIPSSPCRILDNWPSYIARVLPQYLILFNKSKMDFEVEAFWPMVKDDSTGEMMPKDFGKEDPELTELLPKPEFLSLLNQAIADIPEALSYSMDVLMYLVFGITFSRKRMIPKIAEIVKLQMYEKGGGLI